MMLKVVLVFHEKGAKITGGEASFLELTYLDVKEKSTVC